MVCTFAVCERECTFFRKNSQKALEQGDGMLLSVAPVGCRRWLTVQEAVMGVDGREGKQILGSACWWARYSVREGAGKESSFLAGWRNAGELVNGAHSAPRKSPRGRCAWAQTRVSRPELPPGTRCFFTSFCRDDVSSAQLRAGKVVSLHHVCEEELPPGPLPQLEARGHGGPLHVRHPAEQPRALHRPRGARAFLCPVFRELEGVCTLCVCSPFTI